MVVKNLFLMIIENITSSSLISKHNLVKIKYGKEFRRDSDFNVGTIRK